MLKKKTLPFFALYIPDSCTIFYEFILRSILPIAFDKVIIGKSFLLYLNFGFNALYSDGTCIRLFTKSESWQIFLVSFWSKIFLEDIF